MMQTAGVLEDKVVLVDEHDTMIGVESKLKAHQDGGRLHRAFSIFIFNAQGQMLLQRRARTKYHFGGLWTNACCSHPRPEGALAEMVQTRLQQEFGFTTALQPLFSFVYRAEDGVSGLTEHEFDHVFYGEFNGTPQPNPEEVEDWMWIEVPDLLSNLQTHSHLYTPWFHIAMRQLADHLPLPVPKSTRS